MSNPSKAVARLSRRWSPRDIPTPLPGADHGHAAGRSETWAAGIGKRVMSPVPPLMGRPGPDLGVDICEPGHDSVPARGVRENEMTPTWCSFLRALHD